MTVSAVLTIYGTEPAAGSLAAFVGNEVRGVYSTPIATPFGPFAGRLVYEMMVYADGGGETMTFRFEQSDGTIVDLTETIVFSANGQAGTATSPLQLTLNQQELLIDFAAGWTWFSFPLGSSTASSVNEQLAPIAAVSPPAGNDELKSQNAFTRYYAGYGWYGTLAELGHDSSYRINLNTAAQGVRFVGIPCDLDQTTVPISTGWTFLAYLPLEERSCGGATCPALPTGVVFSPEDQVKSQTQFATYYDGYGWYGTLTTFNPGNGYSLKVAIGGVSARYSSASGRRRSLLAVPAPEPSVPSEAAGWSVNAAKYELSMTFTAVVKVAGALQEKGGVAAYVDGELRGAGYASPDATPFGPFKGHHTFPLMVWADGAERGKQITFVYRASPTAVPLHLDKAVAFEADTSVGDAVAPLALGEQKGSTLFSRLTKRGGN